MSNEVDQEVKVSVKTGELGADYQLIVTTSCKELQEYITGVVLEELMKLRE